MCIIQNGVQKQVHSHHSCPRHKGVKMCLRVSHAGHVSEIQRCVDVESPQRAGTAPYDLGPPVQFERGVLDKASSRQFVNHIESDSPSAAQHCCTTAQVVSAAGQIWVGSLSAAGQTWVGSFIIQLMANKLAANR